MQNTSLSRSIRAWRSGGGAGGHTQLLSRATPLRANWWNGSSRRWSERGSESMAGALHPHVIALRDPCGGSALVDLQPQHTMPREPFRPHLPWRLCGGWDAAALAPPATPSP